MNKLQTTNPASRILPILTTPAGQCLTAENYARANIDRASCHLDQLLMKPGYDTLTHFPNLAAYLGWPASLALNAAKLQIGEKGICTLRSNFDGRLIRHPFSEILNLIAQLKPEFVLLPDGALRNNLSEVEQLPDSIFLFISKHDFAHHPEQRKYGVYLTEEKEIDRLFQTCSPPYPALYFIGDDDLSMSLERLRKGVQWVETDRVARDAMQGIVYCETGSIDVREPCCATRFEIIETACPCATCNEQLTLAYLHHLLANTPLLCQRLLIQHNLTRCSTF